MKRKFTVVPALLILVLTAGSLQAGTLAASTRQTFTTPITTSLNYLALDDSGATSLTFTTASTQTVVVSYSADCQVATAGNAVGIIIYVDGVAAAGTGALSAGTRLCSSDFPSTNTRISFITVGAGTHTVQVTGQIIGTGTGNLKRTTTVVQN